jgi:hypothetical protein
MSLMVIFMVLWTHCLEAMMIKSMLNSIYKISVANLFDFIKISNLSSQQNHSPRGVVELWLARHIMIPCYFAVLLGAILIVGCTRWDTKPGDYVRDMTAMTEVTRFISSYGWNSSTNEEDLGRWQNIPPHFPFQPHYIHDLPWNGLRNQKIQALTNDGILYVLSNPDDWRDSCGGIAYNPQTNRFPAKEGICFKPIGEHWYVWDISHVSAMTNMPRIYE